MFKYKKEFRVFNSKIKPSFKTNYLVSVPEDFNREEKLPMIIFLHGAGERGDNPNALLVHGVPKLAEKGLLNVRAIVLAPQVPDHNHVWWHFADEVMELIENIAEEFNANPDKISLTGISMGGFGTWDLATFHSGIFSCIAPICGGGMAWAAGGLLKDTPIRAYHGDADTVVNLCNSTNMIDAINALGGRAELVILHNVGHDSWSFAYEHTDLIEWLVSHTRKKQ